MASQANKTQKTSASVTKFIESIKDENRRRDAKTVLRMMKKVTSKKPFMWGDSIVGFGEYEYKRSDGSEHKYFQTGFSPRKQALTLYIMAGFSAYNDLLKKLGKFKHSKSCLYIKDLEDIDLKVLERLIKASVKEMNKR